MEPVHISNGTRSYFFSVDTTRDLFLGAGFIEVELEYCCIKSVNRRKGKTMRRVWIHGKFRKPDRLDIHRQQILNNKTELLEEISEILLHRFDVPRLAVDKFANVIYSDVASSSEKDSEGPTLVNITFVKNYVYSDDEEDDSAAEYANTPSADEEDELEDQHLSDEEEDELEEHFREFIVF